MTDLIFMNEMEKYIDARLSISYFKHIIYEICIEICGLHIESEINGILLHTLLIY